MRQYAWPARPPTHMSHALDARTHMPDGILAVVSSCHLSSSPLHYFCGIPLLCWLPCQSRLALNFVVRGVLLLHVLSPLLSLSLDNNARFIIPHPSHNAQEEIRSLNLKQTVLSKPRPLFPRQLVNRGYELGTPEQENTPCREGTTDHRGVYGDRTKKSVEQSKQALGHLF
jgi:hypothetical protein